MQLVTIPDFEDGTTDVWGPWCGGGVGARGSSGCLRPPQLALRVNPTPELGPLLPPARSSTEAW